MSGFTPSVNFTLEFDGDTIDVTCKRLKRKDMIKLSPYINVDEDGGVKMSFESQMKMFDVMSNLLPEYIIKFDGLTQSDGSKIDIKGALAESYFNSLTGDLISNLMRISSLSEEESKNSDVQLAESSAGTERTEES